MVGTRFVYPHFSTTKYTGNHTTQHSVTFKASAAPITELFKRPLISLISIPLASPTRNVLSPEARHCSPPTGLACISRQMQQLLMPLSQHPQYLADRYLCGGRLNGAFCDGTVTATMATVRKAMRQHRVEDKRRKHDEMARQMRRKEARRLWGQNGSTSRSQNSRATRLGGASEEWQHEERQTDSETSGPSERVRHIVHITKLLISRSYSY
ncbi:hypothetical protein FIBSPDRAFT_454758 [Athelia psychrophila]|uniref:Uncharacterized protein n=1 Tax=Athelia psychrophila TaxID=1759441 RepID=A0A167UB06_9AGAM|nr:hypothetical protein FIBSPDRAFT_454758 [Fibularhizoctonia sp. CBS 109695]